MGVGNIRDVGEERTKRGTLKVAATGEIATKIATLNNSLQENKHITVGNHNRQERKQEYKMREKIIKKLTKYKHTKSY